MVSSSHKQPAFVALVSQLLEASETKVLPLCLAPCGHAHALERVLGNRGTLMGLPPEPRQMDCALAAISVYISVTGAVVQLSMTLWKSSMAFTSDHVASRATKVPYSAMTIVPACKTICAVGPNRIVNT